MIINDFILQNKELSFQMKIYSDEIEKLVKIRDLLRHRPTEKGRYNIDTIRRLTGKIDRVKKYFLMLNEAYDEEAHKGNLCTSAFVNEAATECQEIEEFLLRLTFIKNDQ